MNSLQYLLSSVKTVDTVENARMLLAQILSLSFSEDKRHILREAVEDNRYVLQAALDKVFPHNTSTVDEPELPDNM